jgi:hypothetical protein
MKNAAAAGARGGDGGKGNFATACGAAQQRSLFIKHFLLKAAEQVFRPRASTHTSIN